MHEVRQNEMTWNVWVKYNLVQQHRYGGRQYVFEFGCVQLGAHVESWGYAQ